MTHGLWTPDIDKPRTSWEVAMDIASAIVTEDATELLRRSQSDFAFRRPALYGIVDRCGDLLQKAAGEMWVKRTFVTGSVLADLAYRESGFSPAIEDEIVGDALGSIIRAPFPEGVHAFASLDEELINLLDTTGTLLDPSDEGGTLQVMSIGAGCVRICYNHALDQAA